MSKHAGRTPTGDSAAVDIPTEERNPRTLDLDQLDALSLVRRLNDEDLGVAPAVAAVLPEVASAVDVVVDRLRLGGRLVYIGAGTSGRICDLDAASCRSTFGVSNESFLVLQAGTRSRTHEVDGAEDDASAAINDVSECGITSRDVLVAVSASGNTPYVVAATQTALSRGAAAIVVTANRASALAHLGQIVIAPATGPEALTGSTRLKAATAQKLILNMVSTGVMVLLGKAYSNLMVDMLPENVKLRTRALDIICMAATCDRSVARIALRACSDVKVAILHLLTRQDVSQCVAALSRANGQLRAALTSLESPPSQS